MRYEEVILEATWIGLFLVGVFVALGLFGWLVFTALNTAFGSPSERVEQLRLEDQANQKKCLDRGGELTVSGGGWMQSCVIRGR